MNGLSDIEAAIKRAIFTIVGGAEIDAHAPLFNLNIDSLDFAQLIIEVEVETGLHVPDKVFSDAKITLEQLAQIIHDHNKSGEKP